MTTKLIFLGSILLCGPALAADPQKASTDTPKAAAVGKESAELQAWLKAKAVPPAASTTTARTSY